MPFIYSEVVALLQLQGKEVDDQSFLDYLQWGGMPQRFELTTEQSIRIYLEDVLNSIIYKDILSNEKKVDKNVTNKIIQYLFENTGNIFSDNSVYKQLKDSAINLQKPKVYDIVSRIINAMAINKCSRYDIQGKQILSLFERYYAVDLGLRTAMTINGALNYGASLETLLYNECIARGYEVYVGKTYKGVVDFMILYNGSRVYVQVRSTLADEETRNREFRAFSPILDAHPKYVISMDREDYSQDGITHLNVMDLLLEKVSLF